MLRGGDTERIRRFGHERLSTWGIGSDHDAHTWRSIFRQLLALGYLELDPEGYGTMRLTSSASAILKGETDLRLRQDTFKKRSGRSSARRGSDRSPAVQDLDPHAQELFEKLRSLRRSLAEENGVPPYVIFHDRTLAAMAQHRPTTGEDLLELSGIGLAKKERWGEAFMSVIKAAGQP